MALSKQDARMAFVCEQFDTYASLVRTFVLCFYYEDGSLEMTERKNSKLYLKRTAVDIPRSAFYLGATVNVLGKPTKLTEYADDVTRRLCEEESEGTVVLIAEESFASLGRCISILTEECGFTVADIQMVWVQQDMVDTYELPAALGGTRIVAARVLGANAVEKGFDFLKKCSGTCTAADAAQAVLWGKLCAAAAAKPLAVRGEANSTVVVIKPHVILSRNAGSVIQRILDTGLEPTALSQMTMSSASAEKFLEPYRGVLPALQETVRSFEGTVWVLQLVSLSESVSAVPLVRQVCGPFDPVVAKKIARTTLRATYGLDQGCNAVHCCDLDGEGPIYTDFFFPPS